jgi:U4/U6.U5 tri-snRNP-associated protein 3
MMKSAPPTKATSADPELRSKFEKEREERMAKLRQEIQQEDDVLAEKHDQIRAASGDGGTVGGKRTPKPQEEIIEVNQEELAELDEEEQMRRLLGFDGFSSTKGEAVEDNHSSAARGVAAKNKARKYRQYMNRKQGFNRPLEKMN